MTLDDRAQRGLAYVRPDVVGILALGVLLFTISIRRFARLARWPSG